LSHIADDEAASHHRRWETCALADIYPPTRQREALLKLVEALGCRDVALRRDECGDWRIKGRFGHIYAVPGTLDRPKAEGFQIFYTDDPVYSRVFDFTVDESASVKDQNRQIEGQMERRWSHTKKTLTPFMTLLNDASGEGMLFMDRLPTPDEAEIIRAKLGIPKKREVSEEERARLAGMGHRFVARRDDVIADVQTPKPASDAESGQG
jgi:hypothetical protein